MRKHDQLIRQIEGETKAHHHWQQRAEIAERDLRNLTREFEKMKGRAIQAENKLANLRVFAGVRI